MKRSPGCNGVLTAFCGAGLMLLSVVSVFGTSTSLNLMPPGASRMPIDAMNVSSPNKVLKAVITTNDAHHLTWAVLRNEKPVMASAPLGLTVDGQDLGQGAKIFMPRMREFKEEYPIFGNHRKAASRFSEAVIPVKTGKISYELTVRVFDDGVAVRSLVPVQGTHQIAGEAACWRLPEKAKAWWAKYGYEQISQTSTVGEIPAGLKLAPPVTVELGNNLFATLTEADNSAFPDMGLTRQGRDLISIFPACAKGWKQDGLIITPWRVAIIAEGLTALVNSDLLTNLCPAPTVELATADWIKPGRVLWQWWSVGAPKLEDQRQWVDAAKKLGFEYYLIDDGWRTWRAPGKDQWQCLKDVIDYGKSQGVASLVWVDSKEMRDDKSRRAYLEKVAALGAAGIKIDFIPPATPEVMKWYEGALADTAELHLLCNFHGAVKPTGRRRAWPHELTREAVRGHEWHMTRYKRVQLPSHDVSLPFLRFMAGPADYTPTAFDPHELLGYTWPHELAQAIVLSSPLLHFTDNYTFYIGSPAEDVLRALSTVWDETIVLPGSEIGKVVGFARRKGSDWFVGVMNGGEAAKMKIDFKFLGEGGFKGELFGDVEGKDDAFKKESRTVKAGDSMELELRPKGGFVAWLRKDAK